MIFYVSTSKNKKRGRLKNVSDDLCKPYVNSILMNYVSDTIFSKLAMLSGIILYNAAMFLKQGIQMLTPEQVKSLIEGVAACEHVEVEGDGHHFFAVIVSSEFEGKARLARHRLIKDGLKAQLASNELHALSISVAATPAEWAAKQQ